MVGKRGPELPPNLGSVYALLILPHQSMIYEPVWVFVRMKTSAVITIYFYYTTFNRFVKRKIKIFIFG
jgi:hypothetical protein